MEAAKRGSLARVFREGAGEPDTPNKHSANLSQSSPPSPHTHRTNTHPCKSKKNAGRSQAAEWGLSRLLH